MFRIVYLDEIANRLFQARKRAEAIEDAYLCYLLDVTALHVKERLLEAFENHQRGAPKAEADCDRRA